MLRAEPIIAEQLINLRRCNKVIYSLSPCTPDTHVVQFLIVTKVLPCLGRWMIG